MISSNEKETKTYKKSDIENDENLSNEKCHSLRNLNKNSFFNLITIVKKNVQLTAPYPSDLKKEELLLDFSGKNSSFLEGFEIKDADGIYCTNEEIVKKQSGVFSDMAKQLAKMIFRTNAISLSLPVRIFEPRSMLERYTDWWVYAPVILKKASLVDNKLEAFKYVICFSLSAMYLSSGQMKPFNPLLGETFEGNFSDGTKIFMEHTSHTPCVSNYYVNDIDDKYKFHGFYDISIEGTMKMLITNYLTCVQKGTNHVEIKNTQQKISYHYPKLILGGMVYGKRYVLWDGHMKYEDRQNNIKATIFFNKNGANLKNKRFHDIYGQIYYYDYSKEKKCDFFESKTPKNPFPSDKRYIISEITGSWLEGIYFDGKLYWSIKDNSPPTINPELNVLPSDSRYREDLLWLKRAMIYDKNSSVYQEYSQNWKLALEIQQRLDRTHRTEKKK